MPHDERWLRELPIEAECAAYRLRGLSYLCSAWGCYRDEVGDPGPEGHAQVMEVLRLALEHIAAELTPPPERPGPLPEAPRIPNTPEDLLRG